MFKSPSNGSKIITDESTCCNDSGFAVVGNDNCSLIMSSPLEFQLNDSGDNFWKPNRYRSVVRRVEEGYRCCNDMSNFLLERAELEKAFARQLCAWSKRWNEHLSSEKISCNYESTNRGWSSFLVESNRIADLHTEVADSLKMVVNRLKSWQRDNYVKGVIHNKTIKEFDDDFRKAQKPWVKGQSRLQKAKRDFHSCSRSLNTAQTIKTSVECDISLTAESKKKAAERYERARRDKESSEQRYKACINELSDLLPIYKEQMLEVFNRSRAFEKDRLICLKDIMQSAAQSVDVSSRGEIRTIYSNLVDAIDAIDPSADISAWASQCGADQQEFPNEAANTTNGVYNESVDSSVSLRESTPDMQNAADNKLSYGHTLRCKSPSNEILRPIGFVDQSLGDNVGSAVLSSGSNDHLPMFAMQKNSEYPEVCNPFNAPRMPNRNAVNPFVGEGQAVPVRALYTYIPQESDELALEEGMVFMMIAGEDEQGWSKGRHGSKEGLYPAAYAEPIGNQLDW